MDIGAPLVTTPRTRRARMIKGLSSSSGKRVTFSSNSKSLGRLRTSKFNAKKNKKYRKRSKFVLNGTTSVIETGGTASSGATGEIVYIGHSTPIRIMKESAWWTVLRSLFIKAGIRVSAFYPETVLTNINCDAADVITLTYRLNNNSTLTSQVFTVGTNTVEQMYQFFSSSGAAWNVNTAEYVDLSYFPKQSSPVSVANHTNVKLDCCTLHFNVKCDLKLQNRTIAAAANVQSDDVNNTPVYGKSYEGTGTGAIVKGLGGGFTVADTSWVANNVTGVIKYIPDTPFKEPLDYQMFEPISKIGKIHLDPGNVKTSILTKKISMNFSRFMNEVNPLAPENSTDVGKRRHDWKLASYRFFGIEKMLDSAADDSRTAVLIAFEHNVKIMCNARFKYSNPTNMRFVKNRI